MSLFAGMATMRFAEYWYLVRSDCYRACGRWRVSTIGRALRAPGLKFLFWMRTCAYLHGVPLFRYTFFLIAWLIHRHYLFKYDISISYYTRIGSGLQIGHTGGIVVASSAIIGKNCNLSHQVTIGVTRRGDRAGAPTIGDNVYIGPGAKIIGNVKIGNHAAIGANCVVTKDVPDHAVVVGVPGRIVSYRGSEGYVNLTDYE